MNNKIRLLEQCDDMEKRIASTEEAMATLDLKIDASKVETERLRMVEERTKMQEEHDKFASDLSQIKAEIAMFKHFDKVRFFNNLTYLLAVKNIKLGDIERDSGNSPGYLSRMKSGKSNADPSIEFIITAAKKLGVSVDMLVNSEIREMSQTELYLKDFGEKLIEDTRNDKLTWVCQRQSELEELEAHYDEYDNEPYADHPIFSVKGIPNDTNFPTLKVYYDSRFYKNCGVTIGGDCYHADLVSNGNVTLYLMSCKKGGDKIKWKKDSFWELYLYKLGSGIHPLCNTMEICSPLEVMIDSLLKEIRESVSHVHINDEVKDAIDRYLGDI
ncbi:MAG: hypothetical protein NC427_02400 [Ruminococcus flavefaciens]|nr:hypothetical protein [Ruminococcus flavefaciens]